MREFQQYLLEQIQLMSEEAKSKSGLGHMYLHVGKLSVFTKNEGRSPLPLLPIQKRCDRHILLLYIVLGNSAVS